jgi:hypothetical protein
MWVRYWLALTAKTKSGGVCCSQFATAAGFASR